VSSRSRAGAPSWTRRWAGCLVLLCLNAGRADAAPAKRQVGWAVTLGGNTFRIWGSAETGIMPKGTSVSPDGRYLYVTNFGRKDRRTLDVFDAQTLVLQRSLDLPGNSIESSSSPDGRWLYYTNYYGSQLHALDTRAFTVRASVKPGAFPKMLTVSPTGRTVYVTNWTSGTVTAVDTAAFKVLWSVHIGANPRGVSVSPDERRLYVTRSGETSVVVVDTALRKIVGRIVTDKWPRHTALTRDGKRLYVATQRRSLVEVIDTATLKIVGSARLAAGGPRTMALSVDERFVYAAGFPSHALDIVDTLTLTSEQVPLDLVKGSGLAVHPTDRMIYVTGWCSQDVWAVERITPGAFPRFLGRAAPRRHGYARDPTTAYAEGCPPPRRP
jgi:YVTN family beta-propeller protein